MKTLLVIGGSGFFGKSILDAYGRGLLDPWGITKVIVMARNPESLLITARHLLIESVELIKGDISGIKSIPYADYVIHAAASTDARDYVSRPEKEKKNIQAGTLNYCKLAKEFHSESKILFVSSGAVYGAQPSYIEKIDEDFRFGDETELPPNKLNYAVAKRDAENEFIQLGHDGLNVSIARCFAFLGCWLPRDQHFAIGNFIDAVLKKEKIIVKANFPVYRSYMYADDLVEWLMTINNHASPLCPIYNVGSDESFSLKEIVLNLSKKYSSTISFPSELEDRIDRYVPSVKKAKIELGLFEKYDLESAISETINKIKLRL
jgi:dTDP-glucose 4,6-dehydratase